MACLSWKLTTAAISAAATSIAITYPHSNRHMHKLEQEQAALSYLRLLTQAESKEVH